jgi:hypothetical protein
MPRSLRALVVALLLVVATGALAACGGGSKDSSAGSLLSATFGPDHPVRSGKLDVSLAFDAKGLTSLKGPLSLKLNGPFQSVGKGKLPKFDFNVSVNTGSTHFAAGAISTGDKGYLKLAGTNYAVTDSLFAQFKNGYEQASKTSSTKSAAPSFKSLGIDPQHWLKNPSKAGEETLGGVQTVHITSGIDIGKFLDDVNTLLGKAGSLGQGQVPSRLTDQQRKDIERSITSAKLDLWTGKDDKTLRRLKLNIGIAVPSDVRKRAGGLQTGTLAFDLTIADLNQAQQVTAPANARPLSELTQALSAATGGGSSSTGGASSSAGGTSSGGASSSAGGTAAVPAGASQEYLTCLQKAGSDVAAVQKCASLLGK